MSEQAKMLVATIPWWEWLIVALVVVALAIWGACAAWAAFHRSILLDRARARASHGVRITNEDGRRIHLHVLPGYVTVCVPRGWMTDAEVAKFAEDIARSWKRQVRQVKPGRCMRSLWITPVWSIRL